MGSNKKVTPEIERMLQNIWTDERTRGKDLEASTVLRIAESKLGEDEKTKSLILLLPKKRKAQYIIKEARERYENLPKDVRQKVEARDKPWSVSTLSDYEIPPETLPIVLKVAAYSKQTRGQSLSIREAKWVARLSTMKNRIKLYSYALEYADMEKVKELTGESAAKPMDLGLVVDSEFYTALTDKEPNEEVFDKDGNEYPSTSSQLILEGLVEQEGKKGMKRRDGKKRKGGKL